MTRVEDPSEAVLTAPYFPEIRAFAFPSVETVRTPASSVRIAEDFFLRRII
jgi:hypothetical protein